MWTLFESRHQRDKDTTELRRLFRKYGDETVDILKRRAYQSRGSVRDHRHWGRLYRKARRGARHYGVAPVQPAE